MRIDLNADLGESFGAWTLGDDTALLDVVTSANVACGFHAGDPATLQRTCAEAIGRGVVVGAHVAYRDLVGFGRRFLDVSFTDLQADVLYQLGALDAMCRAAGGQLAYVKPHGALYHAVHEHPTQAQALVAAIAAYDPGLTILGMAGGLLLRYAAEAGLRTATEAFADRAYTPHGQLVDRREPGAVLHDPDLIAARMLRLVTLGTVEAVDGTALPVTADSICVHGDTPGAVASARAVRAALTGAGVTIQPFAR